MNEIYIKNFTGASKCQSILYSCKESFLPITYDFFGGNLYGIISDFGRGSWALVNCIGGRYDSLSGDIYYNNNNYPYQQLSNLSCFVGENTFNELNLDKENRTVKQCITKALDIKQSNFTFNDIQNLFSLSQNRIDRNVLYVSGEIWRVSIAVGFAMNKKIFCFPWLNSQDLSRNVDFDCINTLLYYEKIILIPTCRTTLELPISKRFDSIIDFHSYKDNIFQFDKKTKEILKETIG